jgi:hypothetical protein
MLGPCRFLALREESRMVAQLWGQLGQIIIVWSCTHWMNSVDRVWTAGVLLCSWGSMSHGHLHDVGVAVLQ